MEHGGNSTGSRDASDTNRGSGNVTGSPASAATTIAGTRSSEEDGQATESVASNRGEVSATAATAAATDDDGSDLRKPLGAAAAAGAVKHEEIESPEILQGNQGEEVVTSAVSSGNRDAPAAAAGSAVFEGSKVVTAVIETTTTVSATVEEDVQVREREACDKLVKMRAEKQAIIKGQ